MAICQEVRWGAGEDMIDQAFEVIDVVDLVRQIHERVDDRPSGSSEGFMGGVGAEDRQVRVDERSGK